MIARHIHDAIRQVRQLQEAIVERRQFKGYSGKARMASGTAALAGSVILASPLVPATTAAHLAGWAAVLVAGLLVNYAALLYWFCHDPEVRRNPLMLKPALDALPALIAGGVLSVALILAGQHNLLFGTWMTMYGLAQVAYRKSLPSGIYAIGIGYIVCGAVCLLSGRISLTSPWPMGLVFFLGELAGGAILVLNNATTGKEES